MSTRTKTYSRAKTRTHGDAVIERAEQRGLTTDRSKISPHAVRKKLRPKSEVEYARDLEVWHSYVRKHGPSDPRDMRVMKHFVEAMALGTIGKLDEEDELPTTDSLRGKMRRFYNAWERHYNLTISLDVKRSMAPFIEGELAEKLGLKDLHREQAFLTIENYVKLHELLWFNDHHDYVHDGCRVDNANLLNTHCFTSARLKELCQAKYKDLVFLVGWKDGQPDLKLKVRRRECKGKHKKQPEHIMPEKISSRLGPPPLYAQPMLFWLANIISSKALKGNPTLKEVLDLTPPKGRKHWVMQWEERMSDEPVFPEWTSREPKEKSRSPSSWGHQASDWARRARFVDGMGLHCPRREVLVKANDGGNSVEQVLKFADQQNSAVLRRHYLGAMNTIDGAASFLDMDIRHDLTEDFRSATMRWNMDLPLGLPAKEQAELEQQEEYVALTRETERLTVLIEAEHTTEEARELYKGHRSQAYAERRRLARNKLRECQQNQPMEYPTDREAYEQGDWRRSHLSRILHMMPERKRLFHTLSLTVPLRSPEGISALRDLITLRTNDCSVAYQDVLRPRDGRCPVPSCCMEMESIPFQKRWTHTYRCSEAFHKKNCGFAKFCFLCSCWITNEGEWRSHCRSHIDNQQAPFRCNPVVFRSATACAGYCPVHLGRTDLPADERMQQYLDLSAWRRHISECIPAYIRTRPDPINIPCPHSECPVLLPSEEDLWHHLRDIHSVEKVPSKKRKSSPEESQDDKVGSLRPAKKTQTKFPTDRISNSVHRSGNSPGLQFVRLPALDLEPSPVELTRTSPAFSRSTSSSTSGEDSLWDQQSNCSSTYTGLSSLLGDGNLDGRDRYSPHPTPSESTVADVSGDSEPWSPDIVSSPAYFSDDYNLPHSDQPGAPSSPFNVTPIPQEECPSDIAPSAIYINSFQLPFEEHSEDGPNIRPTPSEIPDPADAAGTSATHANHSSFQGEWTEDSFAAASLLFSTPMELVDPELQTDMSPTGHMEGIVTESLPGSQKSSGDGKAGEPAAIDEEDDIWEVEALLAKWKQGRSVLYLVKWKGFSDEANSWEKRKDISIELVDKFDAAYSEYGGNHLGVELLDKRIRQGAVEYFLRWKGRPESDNSWEKESTLSRERIREFEARRRGNASEL